MAMDVKVAAFNVAHDFEGGVVALAPQIGKNHNTLNAEVAGVGSAKLGLLDAVKMTLRSRDFRILDAFNAVCGRMSIPLPEMLDVEGDDCMRALADSTREYSELVAATCSSLADDGCVSDNELLQLQTEAGQVIQSINALMVAAAKRNQQGKPQGAM
ncbi:phage regulatory CII family protein [Variovorax sp. 3P27G3]|jgi:hypothetical protein|uniref:phage regulatory CII family protein n=1 Tax=Variovorax sp. 3P27G3 TaxID=2502214 RepID=UPI00201DD138|nr:phage regulatory CII family protein [Variovorax sp. 3P27G3]